MLGNYRGKRLFAGRLFAGRLFGPFPVVDAIGGGGGRRIVSPDLREGFRRRLISEDELLLLMAGQILAAGLLN